MMSTIQTTTYVGTDGILHIDLPLGPTHAGAECIVTVQVASPQQQTSDESREERWRRIFAATAGKWEGDLDLRPDQGELEERESLD
jgi:hypothetical protein